MSIIERLEQYYNPFDQSTDNEIVADAISEIMKLNNYILELEGTVRYLSAQQTKGL